MNSLIKSIERARPFFQKVAANSYLTAIRDGFVAVMPIVIFSSIFLLITYLPNIWGFYWDNNMSAVFMKVYEYSMGLLAVFIVGTTSKSLADNKNAKLPKTNQMNIISVFIAAQISFLIVSADKIENGISIADIGSKGLLVAFLVAFIVPNIYNFCIKNNITIKMPKEVPGNIAQTFKDMLPFALSVMFFWGIDILVRNILGTNLSVAIIESLKPLFSVADGYLGLAVIYGFMAFFWFIGIHGPSIVEPAVVAVYYANIASNLELYKAGEHASHVLTPGLQWFVATIGGTGATFLVPYIMIMFCKSKELKAVGKASVVPTSFGVNEPVLFGAPLILNPIFFFPFIGIPIINVWLAKFFVDVLKMNGDMYILPWTTPGPLGIILAKGLDSKAFIFALLILVVDFVLWYPFIKAYDLQKLQEEVNDSNEENTLKMEFDVENVKLNKTGTNILVLCAGGGTSGILANALNKLASERELKLEATARAYGQDMDLIKDMDLVILAPQMESMKDELKKVCDQYNVSMATTNGKTYIALTRNAEMALDFIGKHLNNKEEI